MINIRTEHLLPVKGLPDYLESRGFGKRVTMRVVNRWIREGCNGAKLDVVRIDKVMLTSLEAVQRWVEAQTCADDASNKVASVTRAGLGEAAHRATTPEHDASTHLLIERRVVPTELDRLIHSLAGHAESTLAYAAGALFRAGLRTPEKARRMGLEQLLAINGVGPRSVSVIKALWRALADGCATRSTGDREAP